MKKNLAVFTLVVLSFSCQKRDALFKTNTLADNEVKEWLSIHGGTYKNGTIAIQDFNGQMKTGRLNWEKAKKYNWEERDYIDIPFEFAGKAIVEGNDVIAPATFNLVIRKAKEGGYEGALRTIMLGSPAKDVTGANAHLTIQAYEPINGEQGNIWQGKEGDSNLKAAYKKNINAADFARMKLELRHSSTNDSQQEAASQMQVVAPNCSIYSTTIYTTYCYSAASTNPEYLGTVTCVHNTQTIYTISCYGGDEAGGGGSTAETNYPPMGGGGTPQVPPPPKAQDPCDTATKAAVKMTTAFLSQEVKDKIGTIKALIPNLKVEKGFAIMEKITVDPHNQDLRTSKTYTGEMQTGDTGHITMSINTGYLDGLVGTVHTHPGTGYSAPSAHDIYAVIANRGENESKFTLNSFQGNFILAADGSIYALRVTDVGKANAFYATKSNYIDGDAKWKEKSEADKLFSDATEFYRRQFKKISNNKNLVYENAMAAVLAKFETGVTLMKLDAEDNAFSPIIRQVNTSTNNRGKTVTTFSNPCPPTIK